MKNQKSIQILRGTREKILKNKDEKLLKGQPLYNLTDNTLSIGDENSNIDKLPIATNELHGNMDGIKSTNAQGVYDYSISYVDNKGISIKNNVKYDGESIIFSDGSIGTQKGDIIPGAEATGIQAMAFGGKRWNYLNLEGTSYERDTTKAIGNQSFAAGGSVEAHGDFSVAFNKDTRTYQSSSFAIGGGSQAGMTEEEFNEYYWDDANNIGLHGGSKNSEDVILDHEGKKYRDSHSFTLSGGANSKAFGPYSLAFGAKNTALGKSSAAFGQYTYALGDNSTAHGFGIETENIEKYGILGANGKGSFVSGRSADAKGEFAHSLGYFTKADGKCSISVGDDSLAKGYCSISVGNGTYAGGNYSASFGLGEVSNHTVNNTLGALGNYSTHVGCKNIAGGTSSFASGQRTKALADYSFSSGYYSTIESGATASFASGSSNTVKGAKAFVAGESNTVEGTGSFIAGGNNKTSNNYAFAAGSGNTAGGYASVVLGRGLISNTTGQFIAGQYNDENYLSSMAFAVGGGSNVDNVITRKNLLTLYKDGRLRLTQPTANLTDNDVPTLKYVKEEINKSHDLSTYNSNFFDLIY